jgi:O-antigen/teichoic acid export membrane protein
MDRSLVIETPALFGAMWRRLQSPSARARLARGSMWALAGSGVQQVMAMCASIVVARVLGSAGFGELGVTRSTIVTFGVLAGSGLSLAATRYVAGFRDSDPDRAGRVLGLLLNSSLIVSGIAAVTCAALASPLATHAVHAPALAWPLAASALLIVLNTMSGVQVGALAGLEAFRATAILVAIEGVATALLMVAGAYAAGVLGAVIGTVIAGAFAYALKSRALRIHCRQKGVALVRRGVMREFPILWSFALPALLLGISTQPFEWLARVLLARGARGLAEVGIFTAAYSWGQAVLIVPMQVTGPAMPILTNLLASGDTAGFRRLLRQTLQAAALAAVFTAAPVIIFSRWIMRAYGADFAHAGVVLLIIAVSSTLASLSSVLRAALLATGNAWSQTLQAVIWGATLTLVFLLARQHGALALAYAYAVAFAVVVVTQGEATRRALKRRPA